MVRDWLSSQLPAVHVAEVRRGYVPFSKNRLRAEKRVQVGGPRKSVAPGASASKVVRSLDPDAESRGEGKWDLEDANYAKALHRTLFEYARSGQLAAAFDLARQADQPWRAASLRGAMLYYRSINGLRSDGDDDADDLMDGNGETSGGNRNRLLWKAVCKKLSSNPSLDPFERALYGSLAGHLSSVIAVSETWEEHLWAHINSSLETRIDASFEEKASQESSWWGPTGGGTIKVIELKDAISINSSTQEQSVKSELRDVFEKLKNTDKNNIHIESTSPFHIVQEAVIMDGVNDLLTHVESRLEEMKVSIEPRKYAHLLRFFAHLILYLRLLERPLPSATCNSILRHYVEVLEAAGEDELVAMYASSLEQQSAEESYAHFLKSLNLDTPNADRRAALLRAQEHSLDMAAVARLVVQSIFAQSVEALESRRPWIVDPIASLSQDLTETEARLIWAVEWLTYDASTASDAIFQTNALMRAFLSRGRIHAARTLIYDLPAELVASLDDLQDLRAGDKTEQMHYRRFFEAFATLLSYTEVFSQDPASHNASRMETQQWKRELASVVETAKAATLEILTCDWLKPGEDNADDPDDDDDDPETSAHREMELAQIRQLYIPELVLRLHFMLFDSRNALSSLSPDEPSPSLTYITRDLPILVADEGHKLYLEFVTRASGNRLKEYLEHVRVATVECF